MTPASPPWKRQCPYGLPCPQSSPSSKLVQKHLLPSCGALQQWKGPLFSSIAPPKSGFHGKRKKRTGKPHWRAPKLTEKWRGVTSEAAWRESAAMRRGALFVSSSHPPPSFSLSLLLRRHLDPRLEKCCCFSLARWLMYRTLKQKTYNKKNIKAACPCLCRRRHPNPKSLPSKLCRPVGHLARQRARSLPARRVQGVQAR